MDGEKSISITQWIRSVTFILNDIQNHDIEEDPILLNKSYDELNKYIKYYNQNFINLDPLSPNYSQLQSVYEKAIDNLNLKEETVLKATVSTHAEYVRRELARLIPLLSQSLKFQNIRSIAIYKMILNVFAKFSRYHKITEHVKVKKLIEIFRLKESSVCSLKNSLLSHIRNEQILLTLPKSIEEIHNLEARIEDKFSNTANKQSINNIIQPIHILTCYWKDLALMDDSYSELFEEVSRILSTHSNLVNDVIRYQKEEKFTELHNNINQLEKSIQENDPHKCYLIYTTIKYQLADFKLFYGESDPQTIQLDSEMKKLFQAFYLSQLYLDSKVSIVYSIISLTSGRPRPNSREFDTLNSIKFLLLPFMVPKNYALSQVMNFIDQAIGTAFIPISPIGKNEYEVMSTWTENYYSYGNNLQQDYFQYSKEGKNNLAEEDLIDESYNTINEDQLIYNNDEMKQNEEEEILNENIKMNEEEVVNEEESVNENKIVSKEEVINEEEILNEEEIESYDNDESFLNYHGIKKISQGFITTEENKYTFSFHDNMYYLTDKNSIEFMIRCSPKNKTISLDSNHYNFSIFYDFVNSRIGMVCGYGYSFISPNQLQHSKFKIDGNLPSFIAYMLVLIPQAKDKYQKLKTLFNK